MRCAGIFAVAANRTLTGIPDRSRELHVRSKVWVVLEGAHNQTAILREHGLPHVGGAQTHHVIKLRLKLIQRASVRVDAVSDCLGTRKNRRRRRYQAFCTVHRVRDELRADISTREVVVEVIAVYLEANRGARPLLSGSDGLGICLLASGGATTVANT